jgi:hypothetical protein
VAYHGTTGFIASYDDRPPGSGALVKVVALMLGILVPVLMVFAILLWVSAEDAQRAVETARDAAPAAATGTHDMPGMTAPAAAEARSPLRASRASRPRTLTRWPQHTPPIPRSSPRCRPGRSRT